MMAGARRAVALALAAAVPRALAQCSGLDMELAGGVASMCCGPQMEYCTAASGIPSRCDAQCATTWASFASRCQVEMEASPNYGDMEAFTGVCHLGIGNNECVSAKSCEDIQSEFPGAFPYRVQHSQHGADNICAESDNGMGADGSSQCHTEPFVEARNICFEFGARLCSVDELIQGETHGTGCGHDGHQLWSSSPCSSTGKDDAWTETVGDCRYGDGTTAGTHCDGACNLLDTIEGRTDVQDCKDACDEIEACHAFDMDFPFSGTCWLFSNVAGQHTGDGAERSRCYVTGQATATGGGGGDENCQVDLSTPLGVRCCADGADRRLGKSMCDIYAAEDNECSSSMTCAELAARDGAGSWPSATGSDAMVCGESDIAVEGTPAQCWPDTGWAEARALCISAGARLCTVEELMADEAQGTGCGFDHEFAWTSDDVGCEPHQHVAIQACDNSGVAAADQPANCRAGYSHSAVPPNCMDGETGTAATRCCADVRIGEPCGEDVAENLCQMPHVSVTVGTEVDTLTDMPVRSGSVRDGGFRQPVANPDMIVDRSHEPGEWTTSPNGDCATCATRLYLTVDLGALYPLSGVTLWHYHGDARAYCAQKVALSTTGAFTGEEVVVYDTGLAYGGVEAEHGNTIAFDQTAARYVRHWSGRSTRNTGIHFMEIDIYGIAAPQFSTCEVTLHEHYQLNTGYAIRGGGAPNPCYDERSPKWRNAGSLYCAYACSSPTN
jgi:hypothetical protein